MLQAQRARREEQDDEDDEDEEEDDEELDEQERLLDAHEFSDLDDDDDDEEDDEEEDDDDDDHDEKDLQVLTCTCSGQGGHCLHSNAERSFGLGSSSTKALQCIAQRMHRRPLSCPWSCACFEVVMELQQYMWEEEAC